MKSLKSVANLKLLRTYRNACMAEKLLLLYGPDTGVARFTVRKGYSSVDLGLFVSDLIMAFSSLAGCCRHVATGTGTW